MRQQALAFVFGVMVASAGWWLAAPVRIVFADRVRLVMESSVDGDEWHATQQLQLESEGQLVKVGCEGERYIRVRAVAIGAR